LNTAARLHESLLVEHPIGRQEDLTMDVTDACLRPAQGGVDPGIVEAVSVDLVEAQGYIQGRSSGFLMLLAEIIEELVCGNGEITNTALQEVTCESGFGAHHQIRRFRPSTDLPKKGAKPAEVLLISSLMGTYLGDGEAEHG
jgi:hypothetical protein